MPQRTFPGLVLASESPRRIHILQQLGLHFHHQVSRISEGSPLGGEQPRDYTLRLATAKTRAVAESFPQALVIGADTVVVADRDVLGKPDDGLHAAAMLRRLSGRWHQVITGICLLQGSTGRSRAEAATTQVLFRPLSDAEIDAYVRSGEPQDKAGAYAIQGRAGIFVEEIRGCYFNVVGFPVSLFYRLWREMELPLEAFFSVREEEAFGGNEGL